VRSLSPEEAELWSRVAATIRPLSRQKLNPPHDGEVDEAETGAVDGGGSSSLVRGARRPLSASRPVPIPVLARIGNTLDGSWDKRLRSGDVAPDRVVDLHGMNLDRAWRAIDDALDQAIARGDRVLLLITGHHRPGEPPVERGRIRAAVHDWLAVSRHAPSIAAVRGAHRRHGGGGSLYLVLRRR
jgi:DNA-nicking Smr family endonuclease